MGRIPLLVKYMLGSGSRLRARTRTSPTIANDPARQFIFECGGARPDNHPIVQGIAIRPELFRQRLIDNDRRRPAVVLFRKCAATQDRNLEGLEVACRNQRGDRSTSSSRPVGTSSNLEWQEPGWLQRQATGRCRDLDARKRGNAANALINSLGHARWIFELQDPSATGASSKHCAHRNQDSPAESR